MNRRAKSPSVVVGIATHNRAALLRKALESVCAQTHQPLRVAVLDDASTDDTALVRSEFASVDWERRLIGQGCIRARNEMMLSASEDYYVSLDDDAWFLRGDEIAVGVDFLERNPNVAAIAFDVLSPDRPDPVARGTCRTIGMFIGCGHILRTHIARELNGYAVFPGTYGAEEKDLCLRIIDSGYDTVQLDGLHVWHERASVARNIPQQYRSGVCNDLTIALRRVPLTILLPSLIWKIAIHTTFSVKSGLVSACVAGFGDFTKSTRHIWRTRNPVRMSSIRRYRKLSQLKHD